MNGLSSFLPFLLMIVVFYFFIIRPQMRRQKQEKKFAEELKKGDRIVTKSGLHGKISELEGSTCIIETMAGKLKFERSSISVELSQKLIPEDKA